MADKSLWELINENPNLVDDLLNSNKTINKTDKELFDMARSTYPDKNVRDEMLRRQQQRINSENPPTPEPTPPIPKDNEPTPLDEYFPTNYPNKQNSTIAAEKPPVSKYTLPESADFGATSPEPRFIPPSKISSFINEGTSPFGGPKAFGYAVGGTALASAIAHSDFQNRKKLIENYGLDVAGEGNREVEGIKSGEGLLNYFKDKSFLENQKRQDAHNYVDYLKQKDELENNPVTEEEISKLQDPFAAQEEEDKKENQKIYDFALKDNAWKFAGKPNAEMLAHQYAGKILDEHIKKRDEERLSAFPSSFKKQELTNAQIQKINEENARRGLASIPLKNTNLDFELTKLRAGSTPPLSSVLPNQQQLNEKKESNFLSSIDALPQEQGEKISTQPKEEQAPNLKSETKETPEQTTSTFNKKELIDYTASQAAKRGWDVPLVLSHINQESGFNPSAVSSTGAQGVGQMFPGAYETLQKAGLYKGSKFEDILGPDKGKQQIDTTLDYLDWIRKYKTNGDQKAAIQWYVDGGDKRGALEKGTDSNAHINSVLANRDKWDKYLTGGQKELPSGLVKSVASGTPSEKTISATPSEKAVQYEEPEEHNRVKMLEMGRDILKGNVPTQETKSSNIAELFKNALLESDRMANMGLLSKTYAGLTQMNVKSPIKDEMEDYYKERQKQLLERAMSKIKLDELASEIDPEHPRAEGFRDFLQSEYNVDPTKIQKMPLKDMEKALTALSSYEKSKQLIKEKQTIQDKKDAEKEIQKIKERMMFPEISGPRTNMGKSYSIVKTAERVLGKDNNPGLLPKDVKAWNSVKGFNLNELAGAVDSIINTTSSVSGREQAAEQMKSWWGSLMDLRTKAGNAPLGKDADKFIKPLYESIVREKRIAGSQLHEYYSHVHDSATDKVKTYFPKELENLKKINIIPFEVEQKRNQQMIDLVKYYFNSNEFKNKAPDEQTRLKMAKSYVKNLVDSGKIKLDEE